MHLGFSSLAIAQLAMPTLVFAAPLIIAALGELVVERAGVVNIGIEGMMLAGALAAWGTEAWMTPAAPDTHATLAAPLAGIVVAVLAAIVLALPFAIACLFFAADQIVTGTGINLLALGLTGMIFQRIDHPLAASAENLPTIDTIYFIIFSPLLAATLWTFFRFTRPGLELSAIGEAPYAADTAGIPVIRRQFYAILIGAACAGLGGAYLSIMYNRVFTQNMTDGVGFLALAIVIFGRWNAVGILIAGLFFGLVTAISNHLQTHAGFSPVILRLFDMLPYVVSIAALAGVAGKSGSPAALGRPYTRQ